jgi:hypothetical protein
VRCVPLISSLRSLWVDWYSVCLEEPLYDSAIKDNTGEETPGKLLPLGILHLSRAVREVRPSGVGPAGGESLRLSLGTDALFYSLRC